MTSYGLYTHDKYGSKHQIPALPSSIHTNRQPRYRSIRDEIADLLLEPIDYTKLRRTSGKVFKLARYMGRTPHWWPMRPHITSAYPLYLYAQSLVAAGQHASAGDILYVAQRINDMCAEVTPDKHSDLARHVLKRISGELFPKTFTHGPVYMLFVHLHWLTAKCPYVEQDILDDITRWVSEDIDGKRKALDPSMCERVLDRVFTTWYHGEPEGALSFKEYSNDYTRWGTSGGAPKVHMDGQSYRSKWAWSIYHSTDENTGILLDDYDLYKQALSERTTSTIALKEEPAKTREIITTTMASYLRQSYLMYRWGSPRIPSPISSSTWLAKFGMMEPAWFGSIDGERFDHSIPKEFITGIVSRLGELDEETSAVARAELQHMETLKVQWGDRTWRWQGGLLSGWRLTSVLGSLASCCVAEYILEQTGMTGAVKYGVMGDDLILYSYHENLDPKLMVEAYNDFGLQANIYKTTSGSVGEFLRRVISAGGSWAYPALGLRSICYANPWLDHYTYHEETEVSNCWLTFLSRMLPHSHNISGIIQFFFKHCINNLTMLFGNHNWEAWLQTPVSAGGGGTLEFSDVSRWVYFDKVLDDVHYGANMMMKTIFGLLPYKKVLKANPTMVKMDVEPIITLSEQLQGESRAPADTWFKHHINITKTINDYLYRKIGLAELKQTLTFSLPRGLRASSPQRVITFLLQGPKAYAGVTTIQHTKEGMTMYTGFGEYAVRAISNSKRYRNIRFIAAAVTIYMTQLLRGVSIPYGTW